MKNIIKQLESEGHDNNFTMHLDGLLKFGDYHPFRMRMVQLEAYGNWTNAESKSNIIDNGLGLRKLYRTSRSSLTPSQPQLESYLRLHTLRERLCLKLSPRHSNINTIWKPHISAAYVNEDNPEAMTEAMILDFQQRLVQKMSTITNDDDDEEAAKDVIALHACSISYMEMRHKTPSEWFAKSKVSLFNKQITITNNPNTAYLSTHLIVPYFVTTNGTIKRPEHLIAWWSRIFSFLLPNERDHIQLRFFCRLFRDALKPPPLYTQFPHPNYPSLNELMNKLNTVYEKDRTKAPKIVFVLEGSYEGSVDEEKSQNNFQIQIRYPLKIIGAGRGKTILIRHGFEIYKTNEDGNIEEGKENGKEDGKEKGGHSKGTKKVILKGMTILKSEYFGVYGEGGLPFLCIDMNLMKCGQSGASVINTKGRFINCQIEECKMCGLHCGKNGLIEVEGCLTAVKFNVTDKGSWNYGLSTSGSSCGGIHLLYPLTKESVSAFNFGGGNYTDGDDGINIKTVDSFES